MAVCAEGASTVPMSYSAASYHSSDPRPCRIGGNCCQTREGGMSVLRPIFPLQFAAGIFRQRPSKKGAAFGDNHRCLGVSFRCAVHLSVIFSVAENNAESVSRTAKLSQWFEYSGHGHFSSPLPTGAGAAVSAMKINRA